MKFIHSLLGNSFLMMILFAMLFLPIGVMGLLTVQQNNEVLSEASERIEVQQPQTYDDIDQANETTNSTDLWQKVNYR